MRKAILTRYFPPTNTLDARIRVTAEGGMSLSVPYDDRLSLQDNHRRATAAFVRKAGWGGKWVPGSVEQGYVWVDPDDDDGALWQQPRRNPARPTRSDCSRAGKNLAKRHSTRAGKGLRACR